MMAQNGSRKLLWIAYAAILIISMSPSALGVAWIHIRESYQLTLDSLGVLLLSVTLGRLAISLTSGRMIGYFGIGRLLFAGSLVMIVGLAGHWYAPTWAWLIAASFVRGAGNAMIDLVLNTFVAEHYPSSRMNWLHAFSGVGLTLGPLLMAFVVSSAGLSWHIGYAAMIVPLLFIAAAFARTVPEWERGRPRRRLSANSTGAQTARAQETLSIPLVWLSMLLFFVYAGGEVGTGQLTSTLFVEGRAVDEQVVGYWITFFWASFTIGRFFFGFVVDRVNPRVMLRATMGGTVIGALLLCLDLGAMVDFGSLALMGFTLAPAYPTLTSLTPARIGLRHSANAIGFQGGASGMGVSLLLALAGGLAERLGVEVIDLFLFAIVFATFLLNEIIIHSESRRAVLKTL